MKLHIYQPADGLRPYVKQYYFWEDNTNGAIQLPHNLFALGDQYMVFILEGEASVKPMHHAGFTLPQNAVLGHFTCACELKVKGPVKAVIVQLNAYGGYRLLKLDMASFTNYYRSLATHENPVWMQLAAQLGAAGEPAAITALLNNACTQALAINNPPLKQVDVMADYLVSNQGNVSVDELSSVFNLSKPTLERLFTAIVGLPPQLYARMMRFKTAMHSMQQLNLPQWQANIHTTAYYNQAMFIDDYLTFNGVAPSAAATIAYMPVAAVAS
ncbi:MAG TPA: DUF6597 domain-containing transcriptional factor [Chitinophaga sp.]|uniref:DUF6597 domain-containing transcriptional factor n=1 Tax=Chitinophaga sp. TaxID=1869181 RepID=UPI002BE40CED|nr:DUF6597 domain-containing transcriptional factor [Chitinophaga sp.]HVI49107.1 DUF6597 domain-containing transcriptional factor [Chitinophaga sp.]